MYVCMYIYIYREREICIRISLSLYIYIYIRIYTYIHTYIHISDLLTDDARCCHLRPCLGAATLSVFFIVNILSQYPSQYVYSQYPIAISFAIFL